VVNHVKGNDNCITITCTTIIHLHVQPWYAFMYALCFTCSNGKSLLQYFT